MKKDELVLAMDASMPAVQVGLLMNGEWLSFYKTEGVPLQSLYLGVESCLNKSGKKLEDIQRMAYCEGPGSLLGIRLVAMAIRTWRSLPVMKDLPVSAYNSLAMAEALVIGESGFSTITEARRGHWFCKKYGEDAIVELDKPGVQALEGPVKYLGQRKVWDNKLEVVQPLKYDLEDAANVFEKNGFLVEVEDVDARAFRQQEFVKWSGERHR